MRLNSQTGTEGLPVSSINCDKPLRSGIRAHETVMSKGGKITDGHMPCAPHQSVTVAPEPAMTSPGKRAGYRLLGAVKTYGHRGLC